MRVCEICSARRVQKIIFCGWNQCTSFLVTILSKALLVRVYMDSKYPR